MSEVETATRQETVEANIEAAVASYGAENYNKIMIVILKDISTSLAMLVDNGASSVE